MTESKNPITQVAGTWWQGLKDIWNSVTRKPDDSGHIPAEPVQETPKNTNLLGTAADVLLSSMGQLTSSGGGSSFIDYSDAELVQPYISSYFYRQVNKTPDIFGYPLHSRELLNDLRGGFVLCSNASIDFQLAAPTANEYNAVIGYLNEGFFLE